MCSYKELPQTRTLIAIDQELLNDLQATLKEVKVQLELARKKSDDNKLLTEQQAQEYLNRDAETLRYYRQLGLDSFKKGKDRWYSKGDIDAWLASGKVSRHNK